jgi:HSP20 family protein
MNSLVRFEPFRELERLTSNLFRNFENEFFGRSWSAFDNFLTTGGTFSPRMDVSEDEKNVYLHVELPGLDKEDVSVTVSEEGVLTIKGERKFEKKEGGEGKNFLRIERSYGSFVRSFMLPDNVKQDSINGTFEKGVLNLVLEKTEPKTPKQIPVEIK